MPQLKAPLRQYRYWAFISYSHADRASAVWLHRELEIFRIPRRLRGGTPIGLRAERLAPVFIDDAELPAGHSLSVAITSALDVSRFLIVVVSPAAARSAHVAAEIEYFVARYTRESVLTVIAGGRPNAAARGYPLSEECFPEILRPAGVPKPNAVPEMPFAADARGGRTQRVRALRRIAAGMLGVSYESLHRRHRRRLMMRVAIFTVVALAGATILLMPFGRLRHIGLRALGFVSEALPERIRGESDHWVGTWFGEISSTCGNYSGPLTDIISVTGPGLLRLAYNAGGMMKGSYILTYTGTTAVSNGIPGTAYFSIADNTLTINYPYACQTATLTKQ